MTYNTNEFLKMNSREDFNSISESEDLKRFSVGQMLRFCLMQSKLIIALVALLSSLAILNYLVTDPTYRIKSLLQVYSDQQNSFGGNPALDLFTQSTSTSDIGNIDSLYKSRTNTLDIITNLKLNIAVDDELILFKDSVQNFVVKNTLEKQQVSIFIELFEENYQIYDAEMNKIAKASYNYEFDNQLLAIKISKPSVKFSELIELRYRNPFDMFKEVQSKFNVNTDLGAGNYYMFRNKGIIEVSYLASNRSKGKEILNYANSLFLNNNIKTETEKANKALGFIDSRIAEIENELFLAKDNLNAFQERNRTINVDLEIQTIIETISTLETKINELELEISVASNNYTSTNPLLMQLIDKKSTLDAQKKSVEDKIAGLPIAQQQYIDLFRDVELAQEIYTQLQNKRLEYSIKEASTLGNIRIIDEAYIDEKVSPKATSVLIAMFFSVVFSVLIAIIRGLYFLPFSNPAEIEDNGINTRILGVIPKLDKENTNGKEQGERFLQSIESLIVNIDNIAQAKNLKNKILLFTSPTPANGKSFVSYETALKLAAIGKSVCIIDCDFKRGTQHSNFDKSKITEKEFLNLDLNLDNFKIYNNLYFIPKITKLRSSFELINSSAFQSKINFLKEKFDYLIIDTPPILSVSDTALLMTFANVNLCLIRHSYSTASETKQAFGISNQVGLDFDGVIYNFYEKPSGYYGYYGIYGNYAYQYYAKKYLYNNYGYDKE